MLVQFSIVFVVSVIVLLVNKIRNKELDYTTVIMSILSGVGILFGVLHNAGIASLRIYYGWYLSSLICLVFMEIIRLCEIIEKHHVR